MGMCLELLVKDTVPTPCPRCKFSTAHHPTRTLHLALVRKDQVAQLHGHSKLPLTLWDTSEWFRAKTAAMREQLDVNETVEFSLTQVIGVWKGDIHQIKNLVHDDLPAKAREVATDDYYQCSGGDNYKSHSFIPAGAEEDWDADLDQAETSLKEAHHS